MGNDAVTAISAEALLFANMGEYTLNEMKAEVVLFVNMGDNARIAKSAGGRYYV